VKKEAKEMLKQQHERLNPLVLKREIERRLAKVYAMQQRYGTPKQYSTFR
jgi:hypothetical protein